MSDQEIVLKDLPRRKVVYLSCKGPWRQLPDMLRSLSEYASLSGIKTIGPPSAFYYNTPIEVGVQDLTWEVCYPVGSNVLDCTDNRLNSDVREIPATRVAATIHQGSYRKASLSYDRLQTWIDARGLRASGPAEELYLTDINKRMKNNELRSACPSLALDASG